MIWLVSQFGTFLAEAIHHFFHCGPKAGKRIIEFQLIDQDVKQHKSADNANG
jgi:hypothetical protein